MSILEFKREVTAPQNISTQSVIVHLRTDRLISISFSLLSSKTERQPQTEEEMPRGKLPSVKSERKSSSRVDRIPRESRQKKGFVIGKGEARPVTMAHSQGQLYC